MSTTPQTNIPGSRPSSIPPSILLFPSERRHNSSIHVTTFSPPSGILLVPALFERRGRIQTSRLILPRNCEPFANGRITIASGSAISITAESPQTATATLFRPAQPRHTPASASSRTSGARDRVKKFADLLKLTKDNQDILQKMYDNTLPGEEYLGTLAYLVFACQEGKPGGPNPKWTAGRVIRDALKDQVGEFIFRPDLQAFSKTVAEDHTTMLQSLEMLTFHPQNYLKGLKPEYVDAHCPGDYVAGEACIPGTAMYAFVKENLKNQRSKVRSALLANILGVTEGSLLKVPAAKAMIIQVARTFFASVRPLEDHEVLAKLGRPTVKRIIFMRYVTACNYLNHTENKRRCQWTLLDEALADLRARPESDAALYLDKIICYDRQVFDGKRTWATIKASVTLPAPFVEQVLDSVQHQSGADVIGDGLGASGNPATGEDFEEEQ
ncbi:uncharacterized protein MELLADRAFT_114349 [Melampsora larici-populina 98AG31]|uniref:Uncharacterized protein n=1 Tax=Melampsora larici-populina (strain 98AG31 / pathotype 3-4-7) TaxID=747676 RepID=F4SD52_MELLP|nr:uncharacterized protein MELLADRAFT_114349 [Melampsora larici-populina 98AG31]EGF97428.1 hypothetical protein MELLADRAFT_114349 [Melampsora larici-populina 98AG31]